MFQYIFYGLCVLYGIYGVFFCSYLCFVVFKEQRETHLKIRKEYEEISRSPTPYNIRMSNLHGESLDTIIEEKEEFSIL